MSPNRNVNTIFPDSVQQLPQLPQTSQIDNTCHAIWADIESALSRCGDKPATYRECMGTTVNLMEVFKKYCLQKPPT